MSLIHYVYVYFMTVPILVCIDLLWLGFLAKDFYQSRLSQLLGPVNWEAATIFYFMYTAGLLFFVVHPAFEAHSLLKASSFGAVFGAITYATYNLTNMATLKGWLWSIVVVDIAWGAILGIVVASLSYLIGAYLYT